MCLERYMIPELFVALHRNDRRRSKSFSVPSFQMMNVLPSALFSSVVSPWITPSLTDHRRVSPSQPVRSLPLKIGFMPAGSGGASAAGRLQAAESATNNMQQRNIGGPPE